MTSETDADLVTRLRAMWLEIGTDDIDGDEMERLFALARRGAEVQWRPIQEDYEGEVLLWPRGSALPSHFMPLPPPPAGETNER